MVYSDVCPCWSTGGCKDGSWRGKSTIFSHHESCVGHRPVGKNFVLEAFENPLQMCVSTNAYKLQ